MAASMSSSSASGARRLPQVPQNRAVASSRASQVAQRAVPSTLAIPETPRRRRARSPLRGGWPEVYSLAEAFIVTPTAMAIRLEELGLVHRDEAGVPVPG